MKKTWWQMSKLVSTFEYFRPRIQIDSPTTLLKLYGFVTKLWFLILPILSTYHYQKEARKYPDITFFSILDIPRFMFAKSLTTELKTSKYFTNLEVDLKWNQLSVPIPSSNANILVFVPEKGKYLSESF